MNIYSDNQQSALKYLKDTKVNLHNVPIMAENFNIRDSNWNPFYPFHFTHNDTLLEIADFFDLKFNFSSSKFYEN